MVSNMPDTEYPFTKNSSLSGFLSPKSIRYKVTSSLLIFYLLGSMAAISALYSLSHMEEKIILIESFYELNQKILETRRYEKNYLLYGNIRDLMNAMDYLDNVRSSLKTLEDKGPFSSTTVAVSLPTGINRLEDYARLLQKLNRPDLPPVRLAKLKDELRQQGHALTRFVLDIDNQARQEVEKEASRYRYLVLVILAFALVVSGVLSILLVHWIVEPMQYIRKAVAQIMQGKMTDIPIKPVMRRCVECAELIRSLNLLLHAVESKQNQLVQSAKLAAIGKLSAGIAHEINNPLNNISLTAEVLLEDLPNIECNERLDMVRDIVVQTDRAREVVRHLLDFSRIHKPSTWEKIDLVKLLTATRELLKNQIRISQIQLKETLPDNPLTIMGNPNQIQQVLVNIFLNAIQAMQPGGTIWVTLATEKEDAVITITDNGPGIPEDIRDHIFDPFFTTKSNGTGLGLAVSYGIIKEHKGEIALVNEAGAGTSFRITFPLEKGQ